MIDKTWAREHVGSAVRLSFNINSLLTQDLATISMLSSYVRTLGLEVSLALVNARTTVEDLATRTRLGI